MRYLYGVVALLGRILLSSVFFVGVINMLLSLSSTVEAMSKAGIPLAWLSIFAAMAILVIGGFSVIAGTYARIGAALLLVFLLLATYYFHNFWSMDETGKRALEMGHFFSNLALMGAMLLIIANGPGPFSYDARRLRLKAERLAELAKS